MFDVIIAARNTETTVGNVVSVFRSCRKIQNVFVAVDPATIDDTAREAELAGGIAVPGVHPNGKGQNVTHTLKFATTKQIIFSDADYQGLSRWHVHHMCAYPKVMVQLIGVPDIPPNLPERAHWAWWQMSGIRRVPSVVARYTPLVGYLMETQLNSLCNRLQVPTIRTTLKGLVSPYDMTGQRKDERNRDYTWAIKNGWLPKPSVRGARNYENFSQEPGQPNQSS